MTARLVDLDLVQRHRTERAVQVSLDEWSRAVWLPLSQVEIEGPAPGRAAVTVTMPEWLAIEKGLA